MNCRLIPETSKWNASTLQHETKFNAVWRNYHCDYLEFNNEQLSECFQKKRVKKVDVEGTSIAQMLGHYLDTRLENVKMYSGEAAGGKTMILSSASWPHLLWRGSEDHWRQKVAELPDQEYAYWVSPMFVTSEREPYVQVDRALQLIEFAEPLLKAKGYHMINLFDPSAAMTVRAFVEDYFLLFAFEI